MKKYRLVKLADIGKIVTGKTPSTIDDENYGPDYMFIGPADLHQDFVITKSAKSISAKGFTSIKNNTIAGFSILVGCIGWDLGNVGFVEQECATNQQINSITKIKEEFNGHYIYYLLKTKKDYLFQIANVTRTPILNKSRFSEIELSIPEKKQQDQVAEVLCSLDAKIALNNQINAELESMAKLLYDYWFVQFDFPDENGRPYKASGGKMVYSAVLGREVPVGWEVKPLADVTSLIVRGISPKYIENGGVCVLNQRCIRDKTINFEFSRRHNSELRSAASKLIKYGDVLVNSTGVGTLGRVAFVRRLTEAETTVDSHVTIVRADSEKINEAFLGHSLIGREKEIENLGAGSTGQTELSRVKLGELSVLIPPKNLQAAFGNFLKPQLKKMSNNEEENDKLLDLRDWLLPMLMNGQVKVKE